MKEHRRSRRFLRIGLPVVLAGILALIGWLAGSFAMHVTKVTPVEGSGFHWPYYLYLPADVEKRASGGETVYILVLPNNTTTTSDDLGAHDRMALLTLFASQFFSGDLPVVTLEPVFPRPEENWQVYTHALDRDALTTDIPELHRLDLQLEAMIDDAVDRLSQRGWRVEERVLMWGFSASGMFVNRFTLLHPDRVLAAAIQSPGGWPIAPVETWQGECLRYPIGICDLKALTGEKFDLAGYQKVPQLFLIGDQDTNDSVPYRDSYEEEDAALIFELFGNTPVERWPVAESLYQSVGANAEFRLYPGVGHQPTAWPDVLAFFHNVIEDMQ